MENENEQDQPEIETLDFRKPDFSFTPMGTHDWKQRGYYLVCKSCELEHALWVGKSKILVGIKEDGQPIMKFRHELGMA